MPNSAIVSNQVPYTDDINLPGYGDSLVPDSAAREHLVATMLVAHPAPEPSPDALALAAIPPGRCASTSRTAAASQAPRTASQPMLRHAGFTIGQVGDATSLRLRRDRDSRAFDRHVRRRERARGAAESLRNAAVVPDPSASASPDASATRGQRRHGDRREAISRRARNRSSQDHP